MHNRNQLHHEGIVRTIVIDERTLSRELVVRLIETQPGFEVVGKAVTASNSLEVCQAWSPQLVIVGLGFKKMDGIELCEKILSSISDARILVLSHRNDPYMIWRVTKSRVHGYVSTYESVDMLMDACKAIAGQGVYFSKAFSQAKIRLDRDANAFYKIFGRREQQILHLISSCGAPEEIGTILGITKRTVETHCYNIMKKVNVDNRVALIDYARAQGFSGMRRPPRPNAKLLAFQ